MMSKQEEVRERLKYYIRDFGVSQKFICNQLHMHQPVLSNFKKGKIELSSEKVDMIEDYLNSKNVL